MKSRISVYGIAVGVCLLWIRTCLYLASKASTLALETRYHKQIISECMRSSALALGERAKTVDNCFYDAISSKQGVGEASLPSDNRRLCDGAFSPTGRAERNPF